MTEKPEKIILDEKIGLDEFEIGSSTALENFEDGGSILLDEMEVGRENMLEEFENALEIISSDIAIVSEEEEKNPDCEPEIQADDVDDLGESDEPKDEKIPEIPDGEVITKRPIEQKLPKGPIIGFVCGNSFNSETIVDENGRIKTLPMVHLIELSCAGMMKPSWLMDAIKRGASGVFLVSCPPSACGNHSGGCIAQSRWIGERRPIVRSKIDSRRIRLYQFFPSQENKILGEIHRFVLELGELDCEQKKG